MDKRGNGVKRKQTREEMDQRGNRPERKWAKRKQAREEMGQEETGQRANGPNGNRPERKQARVASEEIRGNRW